MYGKIYKMDLSYSTLYIFPIPIHYFDVNEFSKIQNQLIDYCYNLREKDPVGNIISNRGGWQSHPFKIENHNDILHNFLIESLTNFPNIKKDVKFSVTAWININGNGDFNITHCHPTSTLSSVLWIKCPDNCGDIEFVSPYQYSAFEEVDSYIDDFKKNNLLDHNVYINSKEGKMIVFPSHLHHFVNPNKSQEDRISVSFNINYIYE
tara:strand:- start:24 stop:644 length:621 start_codon:yes stop_codon:yes gene_type:complete